MSIPPEGYRGFATTRFVRAASLESAQQMALELVAESVALEPLFAASPLPVLAVDSVYLVWSPLKRSRPNKGYSFIGVGAELEDVLHIERQAGSGWFL